MMLAHRVEEIIAAQKQASRALDALALLIQQRAGDTTDAPLYLHGVGDLLSILAFQISDTAGDYTDELHAAIYDAERVALAARKTTGEGGK